MMRNENFHLQGNDTLCSELIRHAFDRSEVYPGLTMPKETAEEMFPPRMMAAFFRGSVAHGMFRPSNEPNSIDDIDLMGTCIEPVETYFGLDKFEQHERFIGEFDSVVYGFKKFVRLLAKGNPNIITSLFLKDEHYLYTTWAFRQIMKEKEVFLSLRVAESFAGYASGQMHRMEHMAFKGYMGEKRKALVKKHGYDTKNASHLIRLLKMSREFLRDGKFIVNRQGIDAGLLLGIKDGSMTLDEVKKFANDLFEECNRLKRTSSWPLRPDEKKIDEIVFDTLGTYWGERF